MEAPAIFRAVVRRVVRCLERYAFNVYFNIVNKQGLNAFTCPWLIATWQCVVSSLFVASLWLLRIQRPPTFSKAMLMDMLPVGLWHTIGHATACVSFSMMAVSFAHVVKSAEPVISVALSGLFGVYYPWFVWLSLLPIVAGTTLSSMNEVTFAWPGFLMAMGSNLGMVLRNIFSSRSLGKYKEAGLDGINLYGLMSMVSVIYLIPFALVLEAGKWAPMWKASVANVGQGLLFQYLILAGLFYHLYNQASYMVMGLGMAPVTFSVANVMKRVFVVVSTVIFFGNPMTWRNWVGSGVALLGTLLYSLAKNEASKRAKQAKEG